VPVISPDTVVDGRYKVMNKLGTGGMADVWCAEDLQLGRKVALKLLHPRFAEDQDFVERFRREASSAAGLQHPNVVSVYDRGEWEGTYYIAMEFLEGEPLKALIDREAPLDPDRAIELTIQILRAARFAHRRGIIHRDFKPHNVMVDHEGRAKVADFGIARSGASDMTETGSIMGTAHYLSPEQAQGHQVSAQSDLYSVGIILYELLTGRVPFEGDAAVTIALKQVSEDPVPPSHYSPMITPQLEAVVLRALAKEPSQRFADADDFIAALEAARAGLAAPVEGASTTAFVPVAEQPVYEYGAPAPPARRRWWPWALLAVAVAAAAIVAILLLTSKEEKVIPRLIGTDVTSAARRLRNDGFKPVVERSRADAPRDQVIGQDPNPGVSLEVGSEVTLSVSDGPGTAGVPAVRGLTRASARARLKKAGFEIEERREASESVPQGRVITTEPESGSQLERGSSVTLIVSTGPEQVKVPNVVNKDVEDARDELDEAGLSADVEREESEDKEPGTVLRQEPGADTEVDSGSSVTLVVAEEPQQVEVPRVVGRKESEAVAALSSAGLEVNIEEKAVDSPSEEGDVLSQDPAAGRKLDRGRRVTITVGRFDDSQLDPEGPTNEEPPPPTTETQPPAENGQGTTANPPARAARRGGAGG
jgi:eukaryotic-like serine/threonine-protein kinase